MILAVLVLDVTRVDAEDSIDFNRDVKPILAQHCWKCHGGVRREGGLSLLFRDEALKPNKQGDVAIVAGKPDDSELMYRLTVDDEEERMPPKGKGLTKKQVETFRRWIADGASYQDHWSRVKIVHSALPEVQNKSWPKSDLDYFVLAKIEASGLKPSPQASRYELIRRLSLDLTGLPPAPREVEAFVTDKSPKAYENLVDRLLASPAYGERWARLWLDMARYADTQGYEKDRKRVIWRYRDWVIDAFNRDLPFDQFTIEQIAGDLLPNPTTDQLVATAFHRNTMTNTEGGTDDEEFRVAAIMDRITTTWQVWMGTTFNCVQCHNHPYDPFELTDYYSFFAFLNQTQDNDQPNESPTIPSPSSEQQQRIAELNKQIQQAKGDLESERPRLVAAQTKWEQGLRQSAGQWEVLDPLKFESKNGATLKKLKDKSILASGKRPDKDVYTVTVRTKLTGMTAFRIEALPDRSLPKKGQGRAGNGNFVVTEFRVSASGPVSFARATATFEQTIANKGNPFKRWAAAAAIDNNAKGEKWGWAVLPHVTTAQTAVFETAANVRPKSNGTLVFTIEQNHGGGNHTLGRFRLSATTAPRPVAALPANIAKIIATDPARRNQKQKSELASYYLSITPGAQSVPDRIVQLDKQLKAIKPPTTPIMRELPAGKQRTTHVFVRGSFMSKGQEVSPGLPSWMPPLPKGAPANRLGLAKWLVDPSNTLTSRVQANRYWENFFGRGLVSTAEDFGRLGEPPSHPKLLDWLAVQFMNDGWSMKKFCKLLVMSATYRQSSNAHPELLKRDPNNLLLTRGPRFRLSAEAVRDQALAVSGLLSRKMYGPSVMPPQPVGVWQIVYSGDKWATSKGEDKYRRGLYTFWRRTAPYPSMMAFDATSREFCVVRRIRTNTPLAALVTLNDPVYIEAAQALARRVTKEGDKEARKRAALAFELCMIRKPKAEELDRIIKLYKGELAHYRQNVDAAKKIAGYNTGTANGAEPAELAAWTVVGNVIMNLDEFLTKG